jgi:hypothetical protein
LSDDAAALAFACGIIRELTQSLAHTDRTSLVKVKILSPKMGLVWAKLHLLALPSAMDHQRQRLALYTSQAPHLAALGFFLTARRKRTNPIEKAPAASRG